MQSTIVVFISFYHDQLMRFRLDFYRLSRPQNDHKRSKAIIIDHHNLSLSLLLAQLKQ